MTEPSPVAARSTRRLVLSVTVALVVAVTASSCNRKPTSIVAVKPSQAPAKDAPADTAVVAVVDLSQVTLGDLKTRLGDGARSPDAVAQAMMAAVVDVLVLRELAVLDIRPRADESTVQAVDRLLPEVFSVDRYCGGVSEADLKLAYMTQLSRFKHPASWTLWTGLAAQRSDAQKLADVLQKRLPAPPDLPAETTCTGPKSPVIDSHAKPFEQAVADLAGQSTSVQLRRYTFYDQDDPKIARGHFRGTDAVVAKAVQGLRIGQWVGPIDGHDGYHVALVVCRDRRRYDSMKDSGVLRVLRKQLCQGAADSAQKEHIERLLVAATITYKRDVLVAAFGETALSKLPPDSTQRQRPVLPH